MEVLHGALLLREPQELLADRFDERGRGVAGLKVFRGAGGVGQPGARQPRGGRFPGGAEGSRPEVLGAWKSGEDEYS